MKYFIDFEATQFSNEIISIGCVREDGETFSSLVQPKKSKVNDFITKLTGITQKDIENAPPQKWQVVCQGCKSMLEYNEYDIQSKDDEPGGFHYQTFITCPLCGRRIILTIDGDTQIEPKFVEE